MLLSNWLRPFRSRVRNQRESLAKAGRSATVSAQQSVERLETRLYLSGVSASSYQEASSDWFGVVDASFDSDSSGGLSGSSDSGGEASDGAAVRRFLVRLTPEATAQAGSLSGVQSLISDSDVELVVTDGLGLPGQVIVSTTERDSVQVVQSLAENEAVAYFEEDFSVGATTTRFPNEDGSSAEFSRQFGLNNTGQTGGVADTDIDAPEAWDISIGSTQIVASVIDSGVDFTHPDLYLNIWLNQGELPPQFVDPDATATLNDVDSDGLITFRDLNDATNSTFVTDLNSNGYIDASDLLEDPKWADGIDTDDNGFEDDLVGWDFFENDNKPFDEHRHGTHVAGILGAVGDNADPGNGFNGGVTGVNWQTSIMPLRFLDEDNRGDISSAVEAINYSTMMRTRAENPVNVRVSNNSWGASGAFSQTLFDAVAGNERADILFVAAAGNGDVLGQGVDNDDVAFFPANLELDNVISVAAINDRGELASFSNFGTKTVDIAAPGVSIVSTDVGGGFISRSGTSMATPFVAGVGALVFDVFPEATAAEVRDAILSGAVTSASLDGFIEGSRSLNAFGALTASTFAPVPELEPVATITADRTMSLDITVTYTDDGSVDTTSFDIRDIEITRQGFSETLLTPASVTTTTINVDGQDRDAAVYTFTAPGGTFDATDNGTWFVSLREGEIQDNLGLYSAPRELGQFAVSIDDPSVHFVNTTLDTIDAELGDGVPEDAAGRTSLRAAIMHANQAGATTTIVVPDGVYALTIPGQNENASATGDLDLTSTQGITIVGGGAFATTIDAQQLDRVFDIASGAAATITGLTIRNGNANQGGGIKNSGTLALNEILVANNFAETAGGGIFSNGILTITASSIEENQTLSAFFATGGGGLAVAGNAGTNAGQTTVSDTSFIANTSSLSGGGLMAREAALSLSNVTVVNNQARRGDGGGIFIQNSTSNKSSVLEGVTSTGNAAGSVASGGGLFVDTPEDQVRLDRTILAENTADDGADIFGRFLSGGSNLIGQLDNDGLALRQLVTGAADFDLIGTSQTPQSPDLGQLERQNGVVQVRVPVIGGASSNTQLAGLADFALTPDLTVSYSTAELEPNNSRGEAMRLDDLGWSLDSNPDIANSTTIPHVTITGTGDGTFDFYSFTVGQASSIGVFDIDNGALLPGVVFNTELFLFDSDNNLLASSNDATADTGSTTTQDARIEHTFSSEGYYTIAVGAFDSSHDGSGGLTGTAPPLNKKYVLHASVQNHALADTSYSPVSADSTLFPIAGVSRDADYFFSASNGGNQFDDSNAANTGNSPYSAILGDVNGDGINDIVNVNASSNTVSVLIGNGDGSYKSRQDYSTGNLPFSMALGDVNGDGFDDIVTANSYSASVSVLTGNGDGTFNFRQDFAVGNGAFSVALGDLNGDSILDIVTANRFTDNISVLTGIGNGTFNARQDLAAGDQPASVALGDINGDGITDIVTANERSDDLSVFTGNGDGTFGTRQDHVTGSYRGPHAVALGDVNGDGFDDIVTSNRYGNSTSVLTSRGDGTFNPAQDFATGNGATFVVLKDTDGDGNKDIATANLFGDSVSFLAGNGDGTFNAKQDFPVGDRPKSVFFGDVDGDGVDDLVAANAGSDTVSVLKGKGPQVFRRSSDTTDFEQLPSFSRPFLFTESNGIIYWLTSDSQPDSYTLWSHSDTKGTEKHQTFESNSRPDELSAASNRIVVKAKTVTFAFDLLQGRQTELRLSDGTFRPQVEFSAEDASAVAVADINGDGIDDIVTANRYSDSVSVLTGQDADQDGNGDGTFNTPLNSATGDFPYSVALGDVNGDGIFDIVTSGYFNATVSVLLGLDSNQDGKGDGTFAPKQDFASGNGPATVVLADVNGDGIEDIVTSNSYSNSVSVLTGNGDGTFNSKQDFSTGTFPFSVAVDDVNGDGINDIVSANRFSNNVSVLIGQDSNQDGFGDGTFDAKQDFAAGSQPFAVALSDVNDDGINDILITNFANDSVSVLLGLDANSDGKGDVTFSANQEFTTGESPRSIFLGDVNGDGFSDIITADSDSDSVSVLSGNGDGTFKPAQELEAGDGPSSVALGDFNNDGITDIAASNRLGDSVSVLVGNGSFRQVLGIGNSLIISNSDTVQASQNTTSPLQPLPIAPVDSAFGTLQKNRDYEFLQLEEFEGNLLATVRLKDSTLRPGDLQLLLIDAPQFDSEGNVLPSAVENLTLNTGLRLIAVESDELFVDGDRIYLTAALVGERLGSELFSFDRITGLQLVSDLLPGIDSSFARNFVATSTHVYFTALVQRTDNTTRQPVNRREVFELDPADNTTRVVRAGQATNGPLSLAGDTLFFRSAIISGETPQLLRFDTSSDNLSNDARPLGAATPLTGEVTGTVFLDRNGDGQQNAGESGRAGVTLYVDQNNNGRREASEPLALSRSDDPATVADESGQYVFFDLPSGEAVIREVPQAGFSQTSPLEIQDSAPTLTLISSAMPSVGQTGLGLPTISVDQIVFVDQTTKRVVVNGVPVDLEPFRTSESLPVLESIGNAHVQDSTTVVFTAVFGTGGDRQELVLARDNRGGIRRVASTSDDILSQTIGGTPGVTDLTGIQGDGNRGFDSLSLAGRNIGFLSEADGLVSQYYIGNNPSGLFARFETGQVILEGDQAILVERVVESTGEILSGADLFTDKVTLDTQVGGSTGWRIRILNGEEILPLTFFDRILEVSVSGKTAVFRALDVSGAESIFLATAGGTVTRLVDTTTLIPDGFETFTTFGRATGDLELSSVSVDGDNTLFIAGGDFRQSDIAFAVAVGDVTGDGVDDIVTANQLTDDVSVLQGVGDGAFQSAVKLSVGLGPFAVALGDVTGDGIQDIVTANGFSGDVSVLVATGNGAFLASQELTVGDFPETLTLGDVTGDGILDIVTGNSGSFDVSVLVGDGDGMGNGDGTFQAAQNFIVTDAPDSISLGDVTGDGIVDIVISNESGDVNILEGNGNGTFQTAVSFAVGADSFVLALGEVNGDNILDIVTANGSTNDISVLIGNDDGLGNADGTFQTPVDFPVGGENPGSISLIDVTGDAILDVITTNVDSDNISLLIGNGDGTFQLAQHFSVGSSPFSMAVGDVTGDSVTDIVTANLVGENMTVLTGDGSGNFSRFPAQLGLYARIGSENSLRRIVDRTDFVGQTDFPGQTLTDLAVSHHAISGDSIVFRATFSGGTEGVYLAELPSEPVAVVTVVAGETTSGVLFGASAQAGTIRGTSFTDLDVDGVLDAGEAGNVGRTVFLDVNLNGQLDDSEIRTTTDENGEFVFNDLASETEYVVREVLPEGLAVTVPQSLADATVRLGAAGTVEVVLGSVDSGALGNSADGVVTGVVFNDANGDGVRGDASAEPGMSGLTVFVDENGDGILNGGERSSTTTADGSYIIDQLRGTKQAVRVVLPGSATDQTSPLGNAFSTTNLRTVDSPVEVVAGDFNGDGIDDIATTINQASEVRLFLNEGGGSFIAGDSVEVAGGPGSIAVGSFQGPSERDGLVVGHRTTSSVKLLLPQPDNSFDSVDLITPQDILSGGQYEGLGFGPFMVTTGDFNADGNDDIAVASQSALPAGGAVAIFLSDGDGTFTHEQTLTLPRANADFPTAIAAGLVNPGGTVDLVLSNLGTANVTILSNSGVAGSSRFSIDQHLPVLGRAPSSVQLGDLDGDGDNEIVTTNLLSNNVSIFDNNGDGTFATATVLTAGQGPAFSKLIDLDQNGSLDIAFSNSEAGNRFGILRNRGDGTFLAAETSGLALLSDGTLAFSLVVGSFDDDNGDGVIDELDTPDVVVSNRSGESLNAGAGGLTVGLNAIVPGALTVELPTDTRSTSGLNFGLRTVNLPPAITQPDDPDPIDEDAGQQTVVLTGITTGGETETLQVTVASDNTSLIVPVVTFDAGAGTATVRYTPVADQSGTAQITVTVRDAGIDGSSDAADPDSDDGVATASFAVVVNPVNDLPPAEADTFGVLLEDGATILNVLANDDLANPDTGESLTILFAGQPESGNVAIVNGGTQLQYTPAAGFIGQESFSYIVSDNQFTAQGSVTVNVTSNVTPSDLLTVSSFTPNPSGFEVVFSEAFNASLLNLYATQSLGPADVVVSGASSGVINGSLIADAATGSATFIRTGGLLAPDTYTVTIRSAADSFVTGDGDLLDGDSNGTGGDSFVTVFTVAALSPETVTVSIPDFVRGFGQDVNVPADGTGIPLTLSRGTEVSALNLTLNFDTDLLNVTGFVPTVAGVLADFNAATGSLALSKPTEFTSAAGPLTVGYFIASVPDDTLYTSKQLVSISGLQVFDDSVDTALVPSVANSAIHVAAFPGDANASRSYNSPDTTLTLRQATDRIDGLTLYPLADPALISDVTFDSSILANDATVVQRLITSVDVPAVPDLPTGIDPLPARGDDPILSIPQDLIGRLGQTITVPVQLEVTEASGITISGLDVAISYDTTQFSVGNVRVGSLLTDNDLSPFSPFANTATPGQILVTASSSLGTSNLAQSTTGDVFLIDFTVLPTAAGGTSAINLLANSSGLITGIADNDLSDLVLSPAPSNAANDSIDGLFTVTTDVTLVERSVGGQLTVRDASPSGLGNDLTFTINGGELVITEASLPIAAAFGQQISDQQVRVALADLSTSVVNVLLEAGDDSADGSALTSAVSLNLSGATGNDTLTGGGGADTLDGGIGDDGLDGGTGSDTLTITHDDKLAITTTQTFGQGSDLFTNIEQALLEGGSANNRLDASAATIPVTLLGQGGNDTLLGGDAADSLDGGAGADFAEVRGSNIVLTDAAVLGTPDTLTSLEALLLTASTQGSSIDASGYTLSPVTIVGSSGDDTLKGGSDDDLIIAGAGKDSVDGGGGADLIFGGRGKDTLNGDAGNDTIFGGGGSDEIDGGADADVLAGGHRADTIRGDSGTDFIFGGAGRDLIDGDDDNDTLFGGTGRDDIAGGLGTDQLNGTERDDAFNQTVGQDTLIGGQRPQARGVQIRLPEVPTLLLPPAFPGSLDKSVDPVEFSDTPNTSDASENTPTEIDSAFAEPLLEELLRL